MTYETRICSDCGSDFELTESDRRFFEARGLHLPKRCVGCRRLRRVVTEAAAGAPFGREVRSGF